MTAMRADRITLVLIGLILLAFVIGAYRVDRQAKQIDEIIDAQSPLIFAFSNVQQGQPITFLVTCTLEKQKARYICNTEQVKPPAP